MTVNEAVKRYIAVNPADFYTVVCEYCVGDIYAVIMQPDTAENVFSACCYFQEMSNGGLHLRANLKAFRDAVRIKQDAIKFKKICSKEEYLQKREKWQAGRNKYAYNTGNFDEWLFSQFIGIANHPDRNNNSISAGIADCMAANGTKYEVKSMTIKSRLQIPLV